MSPFARGGRSVPAHLDPQGKGDCPPTSLSTGGGGAPGLPPPEGLSPGEWKGTAGLRTEEMTERGPDQRGTFFFSPLTRVLTALPGAEGWGGRLSGEGLGPGSDGESAGGAGDRAWTTGAGVRLGRGGAGAPEGPAVGTRNGCLMLVVGRGHGSYLFFAWHIVYRESFCRVGTRSPTARGRGRGRRRDRVVLGVPRGVEGRGLSDARVEGREAGGRGLPTGQGTGVGKGGTHDG